MVLKSTTTLFGLILLLLFTGSCNIFWTQPFKLSGDYELYLDGELVDAGDIIGPDGVLNSNLINTEISLYTDQFDGNGNADAIDQLIVYNRALTLMEIQDLFTGKTLPDNTDSLAGYYEFENNLESSSIGPTGDDTDATVEYIQGISGQAITGGRVLLDSSLLPDKFIDFTISLWFKKDEPYGDDIQIITIDEVGITGGNDTELSIHAENGVFFIGSNGINSRKIPLDDNFGSGWHMVTLLLQNGPY